MHVCLVLHAHQPYVRRHGTWPCGEDWYHQAAVECYLPLAEAFERLANDGLTGFVTVSITPVLGGQMADPSLTRELRGYLGRAMLRSERQAANYRGPFRPEMIDVAAWYHRRHAGLLERLERPDRGWSEGVHAPFRDLAAAGAVELMTTPPTHAFLPLLADDDLTSGSLRAARAEHERLFGHRPEGGWLPECGYRPADDERPGVEAVLEAGGISRTIVDASAFAAAGLPGRQPILLGDSSVVAASRNQEVSALIDGPEGYPGGPWYRDFHHTDGEAGFKSFRVSDRAAPAAGKRPYEPAAAEAAAREDGQRFAAEVARRVDDGGDGMVVAAFDAELFGHWWFEGPVFLEEAIRSLASSASRPATLSEAIEASPPRTRAVLPASSWGRSRDASTWLNPATEPIWRRIWAGEERLRSALGSGGEPRLLTQAARELLLLAASDWPFMISWGRAADYARERVAFHDRALGRLTQAALAGIGADGLEGLEERDNLLPLLDVADLASRAARPSSPAEAGRV